MPVPKFFRPEVVLRGGRDGGDVRGLKGPPNSYLRGGGDRVFETDAQGRVIRDITPKRVKVRHQNPAPHGVFEEMLEIRGPVCAEDLALLRRMGAIK